MKKQKENSHEGITWSEMGKQNVQAEKVYSTVRWDGWASTFQTEKKLNAALAYSPNSCWANQVGLADR